MSILKKFLKIAGVKTEAEFYHKYPSEHKFFLAHPEAKDLKMYKKGGEMKKLEQLTSYKGDIDGIIPKAQPGKNCGKTSSQVLSEMARGEGSGGGDAGYSAPLPVGAVTWKELLTYNETNPKSKEFKQQYKSLKEKFPDLTKDQLLAAQGDSARIATKVRDLPFYDTPGKTDLFEQAWYPYYRGMMQPNTPVTTEQILQFHSDKPGGLPGYQSRVEGNYEYKRNKSGGVTSSKGNVPKYQLAPSPIPSSTQGPIYDPFGVTTMGGQTPQANVYPPYAPSYTGPVDQGAINAFNPNPKAPSFGSKLLGNLGGAQGIANLAGGVIQGIQGEKNWKKSKAASEAAKNISALTLKAARSRPKDIVKRQYVRPEDFLVSTAEATPKGMYQGTDTSVLGAAKHGAVLYAQDGMDVTNQIGGNPTEIQNMYNPGTMYSDLGYEPLEDTDKVKQYANGGMKKAQLGNIIGQMGGATGLINQFGSITGTGANSSGLYSAIGNIGSKLIPGAAGAALGPVGALAQFAINDQRARTLKNNAEATQKNVQQAAFESGLQGIQGQYGSYMENGGQVDNDYHWMSHTWQPQVIAKFGEHNVSDLLKHDDTMDTLRTGGRVTQNNMFPTDQYAFGGELQTTWGGYAEPISHNPYLPGSGETVMFRGKSHAESDGKGRTGIGVKYGNGGDYSPYMEYGRDGIEAKTDVEVERGEPATELSDPQTGETNMVVFGNLKIPSMFLHEIGDKNAKDKKFKNYANDLSKKEAKQNKILDKFSNQDLENYTPFDTLAMNSANAMNIGAHMKLKDIADKKNKAAMVQNAINETAEEHGIDADALARGKVITAKNGKQIKKAQTGSVDKKITATRDNPIYVNIPGGSKDIPVYYDSNSGSWKYKKPKTTTNRPEGFDDETVPEKFNQAFTNQYYTQKSSSGRAGESSTQAATTPRTTSSSQSSGRTQSRTSSRNDGYVSKYGIEPWTGNVQGKYKGALSASEFTTQDWDKVAENLGFTGRGNKEFEEFLLKDPRAKEIITKRHQERYGKDPWVDPTHFGYGWAAPDLKNLQRTKMTVKAPEAEDDITSIQTKTEEKKDVVPVKTEEKKKGFDWLEGLGTLLPYLYKGYDEPFDSSQLYPEMFALAANTYEPVKAQGLQPLLETPYDISLQDQINEVTASSNAARRMAGGDPSVLANISAQESMLKNKIQGEQFRQNQAERAGVYGRNRQTLMDTQAKNLAIFADQEAKQQMAKSKTKATAQEALSSMSDKIAKQKLENRTMKVYENMYPNYRFTGDMRAVPTGFTFFQPGKVSGASTGKVPALATNPYVASTDQDLIPIYDSSGKTVQSYRERENAARNGSIVQSLKRI